MLTRIKKRERKTRRQPFIPLFLVKHRLEWREKPPHQNTCQHGEFQDDKNVIKLGTLRKFPQRVFPPAALLHMLRSGNECRPQWRSAEQSEKTFCLQLLFR